MAGEKIVQLIKKSKLKESDLSDLVYGQVISTSPLKIRVENRFEIGAPFIELSRMVKELVISITIDGKTGSTTVFRNLRTGDNVRMLRAQKSQKYYVLERV